MHQEVSSDQTLLLFHEILPQQNSVPDFSLYCECCITNAQETLNQHFSIRSLKRVFQAAVQLKIYLLYRKIINPRWTIKIISSRCFIFQAQKPRIEKLRRDRINGSLDEIKRLVLEALNKDVSIQIIMSM